MLELPEIMMVEDFLPIKLNDLDAILGMKWLQSMGKMETDWPSLSMSFVQGNKKITLKGDPTLACLEVSRKRLARSWQNTDEGYVVELRAMTAQGPERIEGLGIRSRELSSTVQRLLGEYQDVFHPIDLLPPQREIDHRIPIKDGEPPVNVCPYRYAHAQKTEIEKMIGDMIQNGLTQPSVSPYSSPVILIKKKDGSWQFYVDYRAFNNVTVPDKFPIPVIDELLDELHGSCIYSKIDLKSGYHQIRMAPEDVQKTAFRTHESHYEFLVMSFGLTNAPATFQSLMNKIFRPFLRKFVFVFFDDILIYSQDLHLHIIHLTVVFKLLRDYSLYANFKKCSFAQDKVISRALGVCRRC